MDTLNAQESVVATGDCTRTVVKAAGFSLMLLVPLLGPIGHWLGCWWLSPLVIFGLVPLGDLVVGEDRTNLGSYRPGWGAAYYWLIPQAYVLVWLGCLWWTAEQLTKGASGVGAAGIVVAAGIGSAFATCAAHEMLHRGSAIDFWSARIAMSMCAYGHFVIEHLHHHATVGRVECGTVPRVGEPMWRFIVRNALFGYRNSFEVAERLRRGRGWWANRTLQQHALTVGLATGFYLAFGWRGLGLFGAQALIAMATVELVQYCEHYGLERRDGEPAMIEHSWNANGWLTNALTLNIARHSEHHLNAKVPYQALTMMPGCPTMPMGYFGMTWLALVPDAWRAVVHPRRQKPPA